MLRRATAYLSQAHRPGKRLYPLVKELACDGIPVTVTCRVLTLSRQPYYRWLNQPITRAELVEAYRAATIRSSGTGSSLMRPATPVRAWRIGRAVRPESFPGELAGDTTFNIM
ncbi:hypothetical protein ASF76_02715 [Microbacterium sp. Leaf151]|nr:hypothetical protein ASF76_02715 [Microbacterium sp. Leaf151]